MKNDTKTNLKEMIELIQKQELLLPDFQRGFVWDIEMQQRLVASVLTKMPIGSILVLEADTEDFGCRILGRKDEVDTSGGNRNVNVLLDGQQRMTTLTLLLIALRDYSIDHPEDISINFRRIDNMLLKNEYEKGDERYKLLLTENDRDILINLIERKPISENIVSRLLTNHSFFVEQIEKKELMPAEIYESIGKLQIVNITLDRAVDDAQDCQNQI